MRPTDTRAAGSCDPRPDSCEADRERDELASMVFASLLFEGASHRPPIQTAQPTPEPARAVSGPWRPSVTALTRDDAPGEVQPRTLTTLLESDELGNVSIRIERTGGGVNVVVAADRPELLAAMKARESVLRHQLAGAGLTVHTLDLVSAAGSGTTLAQSRNAGAVTLRRSSDAEAEDPDAEPRGRRRRARGVNLTG